MRVRIVNMNMLPHQARGLLRKIKDRSGSVADRYIHPHHGYEVFHVVLEPAGWSIKAPVHCCKEIDENREQRMVADYVAEGLGETIDYGMEEERRRHP